MLLEHCRWNPKLAPVMDLTEKDMEKMSEELVEFHETFHDYYGRKEHRRLGLAYLSGLMSDAESKSCEPIALELLGSSHVRSLQSFMKVYLWDHDAMQSAHQRMLSELIADAGGMITVDSSEFVKKERNPWESPGNTAELWKSGELPVGSFPGVLERQGLRHCRQQALHAQALVLGRI